MLDTVQPVDTVKDPPAAPFRITDFTMRVEWQKRGPLSPPPPRTSLVR